MKRAKRIVVMGLAALALAAGGADGELIGLYRFEDASGVSGSPIADSSGKDNTGTVNGGTLGLVSGMAGFGNAGSFSGGGLRVNAPMIGNTLYDFTIAFWMQSGDLGQTNHYVTAREAGTPQLSAIYGYAGSQVELFRVSSGPDPRPGSQIVIADTGWHHVVYTRTGTDYDLYLDGAKTDIGVLSGAFPVPASVVIGNTNAGLGGYVGLLDDVAWFNNGVNASQVSDIMSGNFAAFVAPPEVRPSGYVFNTTPTAPYTDGGGELTDDNAKSYTVWPGPITDASPLVGWLNSDPSITFSFDAAELIGSIKLYAADSDGAAGVGLPLSVQVTTTGGYDQTFIVVNPAGSGSVVPILLDGINVLSDNFTLHIARGHEWTMLAEVEFFPGAIVPTPAALPAGLAMLGLVTMRRRRL